MVAYGSGISVAASAHDATDTVTIAGVPVTVGIRQADAETQPELGEHDVLLHVRAFSCNYRDKALLLRVATCARADGFMPIGSEFVAEVVGTGPLVTSVAVGDRVIGDNAMPVGVSMHDRIGIPTNHASRERLTLPAEKVIRVPPQMSDVEAAAFSLGAQTAYSMVRRLGVAPGARVLVTAGRASTSLFVIGALRARGARVYATTRDAGAADRLRAYGVDEVFVITGNERCFTDVPALAASRRGGGFDAIADPFVDVHLRKALPLLRSGGRYITCGFHAQHETGGEDVARGRGDALFEALQLMMMRNVQLIGNCLGEHDDLVRAIADYETGSLTIPVDSVFGGARAGAFIHRTYVDRARFGKAVFAYD